MATIKVYHEVTVDDAALEGNRLISTTLSNITKVSYCVQDISVAATSTSQVLWTTGNAGITTFTRGLLITDQDLYLELRTDNGSPEYVLSLVEANVPYWFGAKAGGDSTESLDGATLVDGTDFDDVDRIEVQNEGATAATVSLYLFT
jgi:hypothetical protein